MTPIRKQKFECEQCGSCCRAVGCIYLDGNKCSIYDSRPALCRVSEGYGIFNFEQKMSYKEYIENNKLECIELRKKYGL
jgi:Fe-S-cluster containining protein